MCINIINIVIVNLIFLRSFISLFQLFLFFSLLFFFFRVGGSFIKRQQHRYRLIYDEPSPSIFIFRAKRSLHVRVASSIYRDPAFRICHVHGFHPGKADRGEEKRLNPGLNLNNLSVAGRLTRDCSAWKNF